MRRLRSLGIRYCLVLEEGYLKGGMKRRLLREYFNLADARLVSQRTRHYIHHKESIS
ncbi:hypothetical protein [Candidatus Venteria ishoeyi]|uniref:hypothetical protein n=1 Tax=Candidatus Venteria ishoeyi TaxID=1899563 RepID=UPI0015A88304|nr:hypothetical protein [Candidatus Venteria ishoeyi]